MRLQDKVALVTGGGSGIGRATSLRFAAEGAKVVVADINFAAASAVAEEARAAGGQAIPAEVNVADRSSADGLIERALAAYGRLDILINNAGINRDTLFVRIKDGEVKRMSDEQWDAVIAVNLKGAFLCSQAAAVPMIKQGYGRIVNTSSIGALGNIGQANYSASKAGVMGLTYTLALELARYNITVNCVAPGATKTQMTAGIPDNLRETLIQKIPLRRMAEPEEIANLHLFLASDEAAYVTGQVIFCDGGISVGI
jgi:3-oxoacyl-[acyl-carrier protein] reductase